MPNPIQRVIALAASGLNMEVVPQITGGAPANGGLLTVPDPATGRFDVSLMPAGYAADVAILPATEALAAGALVNVWSNAGVASMRNADASVAGKSADGYVLAAVAAAANGTFYGNGINNALAGLTPTSAYFLSDTAAGGVTAVPPTTSGHVLQPVGKAISATQLQTNFGSPTTRA